MSRGLTSAALAAATLLLGSCSQHGEEASTGNTAEASIEVFCEIAPKIVEGARSGSPASVRAALELAESRGDELVASTPADARGSILTFVEGTELMAAALREVGFDASKVDSQTAAQLMSQDFQQSVEVVLTTINDRCGDVLASESEIADPSESVIASTTNAPSTVPDSAPEATNSQGN